MIVMAPPAALKQWNPLVLAACKEFNLDPYVMCADIWQESSGNPRAIRYEAGFTWFYDRIKGPLHDKQLTTKLNRQKALEILGSDEFSFQTNSWGLYQLMGSVARELGFRGIAEELFQPETNIHFGAKYHGICLRRAKGDVRQALLLFNGGGNLRYADDVLTKATVLRSL